MKSQDLKTLSTLWLQAKAEEHAANAKRIGIEKLIVELVGSKEEGSESTTQDGYRVTTTGRLSYKADVPTLLQLTAAWPDELKPVVIKTVADETRLKKIRAEYPDLWRDIARAVEVSPQKTGVLITIQE